MKQEQQTQSDLGANTCGAQQTQAHPLKNSVNILAQASELCLWTETASQQVHMWNQVRNISL